MDGSVVFDVGGRRAVHALNGGHSLSRGVGIHPDRVIDSYELIFVRKSELAIEEEGREFLVQPGQSLVLRPGCRHRGTRTYSQDLSFYWVHFLLKPGKQHAQPLAVPQRATVRREDRLSELFRRFLDDQESGELHPYAASLLVSLMLCEVAASRGEVYAPASAAAALAQRAFAIVKTRFHQAISTAEIAAELECNSDYLGRIFQRVFGRSIVHAIHQQRLQAARKLLLETALNINQIANQCGFSSSVYFCRIFRRATGTSPLSYRRSHARLHVVTD